MFHINLEANQEHNQLLSALRPPESETGQRQSGSTCAQTATRMLILHNFHKFTDKPLVK